jgi:hypothetical protein
MRRLLMMSLVLALGVLGSACAEEQPAVRSEGGGEGHGDHGGDAGEGHAAQGTKEIGGIEATYHGSADVSEESSFQLELDDSYFGPTVLEGKSSLQLGVTLHNEGDVPHTFTIEGQVDQELQPGDEDVRVSVTFPESGALIFYCRFHRDQGMVGALSVDGSLDTTGASTGGGGGVYG